MTRASARCKLPTPRRPRGGHSPLTRYPDTPIDNTLLPPHLVSASPSQVNSSLQKRRAGSDARRQASHVAAAAARRNLGDGGSLPPLPLTVRRVAARVARNASRCPSAPNLRPISTQSPPNLPPATATTTPTHPSNGARLAQRAAATTPTRSPPHEIQISAYEISLAGPPALSPRERMLSCDVTRLVVGVAVQRVAYVAHVSRRARCTRYTRATHAMHASHASHVSHASHASHTSPAPQNASRVAGGSPAT